MRMSRSVRLLVSVLGAGALVAPSTATAVTSPSQSAAPAAAAVTASPQATKSAQPDVVALAGPLAKQKLVWEKNCALGYGEMDAEIHAMAPGTTCATVTVPRDWKNPRDGKTITIRIARTPARDKAARQGILMVNPGGPGGSGLPMGALIGALAPQLQREFDMIGFDPRGVGQSTPLMCDYTPQATPWEDNAAFAAACRANPLSPYITTEQTAYDMDLVRHLLGEPQTSYIGYSYGTWLGSWYERLFPTHVQRFLLDSNTDLSRRSLEETWDLQPGSRDRQFQEAMLPYVARHDATYGLGNDPLEIRRQFELAGGTRSEVGQLVGLILMQIMYQTAAYDVAGEVIATYIKDPGAFAETGDLGTARVAGDRLVKKLRASKKLSAADRDLIDVAAAKWRTELDRRQAAADGESLQVEGAFSAIRCQDGPWHDSKGYWDAWLQRWQKKYPFVGPLMTTPECATWPHVTEMPAASKKTYPDTLLIQTELDAATPYEAGLRSAQLVPSTSLISVDNEGSHAIFPYGDVCVDGQVNGWLLDGTLPGEWGVCPAKPLPNETKVYPVGGEVKGGKAKIKLQKRTDEMKQAERIVRVVLAETQSR